MIIRYFIIRHGQSSGNIDAAAYGVGNGNVGLTHLGLNQAEKLGAFLRSIFRYEFLKGIQRQKMIIHSPQNRSVTTTKLIEEVLVDYCSLTQSSELLSGRHRGLFNGLTDAEAAQKYPRIWQEYQRQLALEGKYQTFWPGGESIANVYLRAESFLNALARPDAYASIQDYIISAHSVSGLCLVQALLKKAGSWYLAQPKLSNCAVWCIGCDTATSQIIDYGIIYDGQQATGLYQLPQTAPVLIAAGKYMRADNWSP